MVTLSIFALALIILAATIYWCNVGGWWGYLQASQCVQLICYCLQLIVVLTGYHQNE